MNLPLTGIQVLDLTTMVPGPMCSMILGDFGAEVVKIEQPKGGDLARFSQPKLGDTSGHYLMFNRNKKSVTLNLKSDKGKEIFYQLAAQADVIMEQNRPGVVKKLGIDYKTIEKLNPRIIYCSISGYGQDGPYAQLSGHDINYLSYAGVLGVTSRKGQRPTIPGVQIADIGGGTLNSVIGILLALMARQQSGKGQYLDIAMMDGAIGWLGYIATDYFFGGKIPGPASTLLNGKNACYEVYETKDGGYISLGAVEPHLWANLCRYFGKEEYIKMQRDVDKQDELFTFLKEQFLSRDRDEWVEVFKNVDACTAPVQNLDEVFNDPHVLHRQMVFEMDHPRLGKMKQLGFPIKMSDTPAQARLAPPDLGQHNEEILGGMGYTSDEIQNLREQGIV